MGLRSRVPLAVAAVAAMVTTIALIPTPSQAAVDDRAEAEGRVLVGDAGTIDLSTFADLDGQYFADPGAPGADFNDIDATVLEGLVVLEDTSISLLGANSLIDVGAVEQYASAVPGEVPFASSGAVTEEGAVDAGAATDPDQQTQLDLAPLLADAGLDDVLDGASLDLGAVSASATTNAAGDAFEGDYQISDGTLVLTSPTVADLGTDLSDAVDDVSDTANGITADGGLVDDVVDPLFTTLEGTIDALPLAEATLDDPTATLDLDLETATAPVLDADLGDPTAGVTLNLGTGTITVDLAELVADGTLNGLPEDTEVLDTETVTAVNDEVDEILGEVGDDLVTAVETALNEAELTIDIAGDLTLTVTPVPPVTVPAELDASITGTLGGFAGVDGQPAPVTDVDVDTDSVVVDALVGTIEGLVETAVAEAVTQLADPIEAVLSTDALTEVTDDVVGELTTVLDPLVQDVADNLLSLTVNVTEEPGTFEDERGFDAADSGAANPSPSAR